MNIFKHVRYCSLLSLLAVPACLVIAAGAAAGQEGREVAEKFDHVLRKSHKTLMTKYTLSSCNYTVKESSARCTEQPRVSVIENFLKFYGDDIRSVALVMEPPRERGTGMLNFEYYSPSKDNATWLYLPAFDKVRRVVSTKDSDGGAFFGSEFLIEDLDYRKPDDYSFTIIEETEVRVHQADGYVQRPAYVLEWKPTDERARKSKYGKVVTWIDKERYILLRSELYNHNGERFKIRVSRGIEHIDGHWWPQRAVMRNIKTRRVSIIDRQTTVFDHPIPDEFLSQRVLTDHAFRERYAKQFRAAWD